MNSIGFNAVQRETAAAEADRPVAQEEPLAAAPPDQPAGLPAASFGPLHGARFDGPRAIKAAPAVPFKRLPEPAYVPRGVD
jgi:hypothetical protein